MKKRWFALLLLALPRLAAVGQDSEVIANSTAEQPTVIAGAVSNPPASPIQRAAYIAPPRLGRGDSLPSLEIAPLPPIETSMVPDLTRVPPPPAATLAPVLRPEKLAQPTPTPASASPSLFAVEYTASVPEPKRVVMKSAPEVLSAMPTRSAIAVNSTAMPTQGAVSLSSASSGTVSPSDGMILEEGFGEGPAPYRIYGSAEYLMWWTKNGDIPPLVTTSDPNTTDFGRLGTPTTRTLFGDDLDHEMPSGARFRLGTWFDCQKPVALESSFFFLGQRPANFFAASDGNTILARPFRNANQGGVEFSELVAGPNVSSGSVAVNAPSSLVGTDLNLRCHLRCQDSCCGGLKIDGLAGFRFLRLREGLYITEQGVNSPNNEDAPGEVFRLSDRFDTRNTFYGGQVGVDAEWTRGRFSVDTRGMLALGCTHQVIGINGSATFLDPGQPADIQRGALLALPSNIGTFSKNRFSVVPELTLTLGYQVTDHIKATLGYNFLFWNNVVRPGDQIDRNLDVTQIPRFTTNNGNGTFDVVQPDGTVVTVRRLNPSPPAVPFKDSSYWAQGLSLGLAITY